MFQLIISDTNRMYQSLMADGGGGRVAMDEDFFADKAWKAKQMNIS